MYPITNEEVPALDSQRRESQRRDSESRALSFSRSLESVNSRFVEFAATLLFAIVVGFTVVRHEPWADEAQAWLIAKHLPFWQMLLHQVRYEGTPGLWHSMLWVLAHAGVPYAGIGWFSCMAATAGTWVLLRYAPFPLLMRVIIPFTFYFCYQFAVIARSYVLVPLLLFTACHLIRNRPERYTWIAVILGLLGNSSVFGLFISGGLVLVCASRLISLRILPRRAVYAALIYTAFVALAVGVALPPRDLKFIPTKAAAVLNRDTGTGTQAVIAKMEAERTSAVQHLQQYTTPLAHSLPEVLVFLAVLVWQLRTRRMLVAGLPALALAAAFELVYKAPRHMGLIVVVLVAVMWLAWPARGTKFKDYRPADWACGALFLFLCLPQVAWSERAVRYDISDNYSGAKDCAEFLKTHAAGKKVFGYGYFTVAVAAYFDQGVFANQPGTIFWPWSTSNKTDFQYDRILNEKPDYVVVGWSQDVTRGYLFSSALSPPVDYMLWAVSHIGGYRQIRTFTGREPMRSSFAEQDFFQVYERPYKDSLNKN